MKFIQQDQVAASRFSAGVRGYFQANMLTSWIARDQPGKNYLSETKQACTRVFSSILGLNAALMLVSALSGCSGAVGTPPDTTPVAATPLAVSPAAADIFPDVPVTFTITGGKPTYSAFTSNSVVLPVNAAVTGTSFTVTPAAVTADTSVDITVRDAANTSATAKATVKPSTLINQITFTPSAPATNGCGTGLCSGNDALVVVKAALNGVVLRGRQIRFEALQGSFKISTTGLVPPPPGSTCTDRSCTVLTDAQGEATVTVVADAAAFTQVATLQITDASVPSSGQSRKYNFTIIQQTSGVGILSVLPSASIVLQGAAGSVATNGMGSCPIGTVSYAIFGGTPEYKVSSSLPDVAPAPSETVKNSGDSFTVTLIPVRTGGSCGQPVFVIADKLGRSIQTAVLDLQRGLDGTSTVDPVFSILPSSGINLCPNSTVSVAISGKGSFVAAIATSVPSDAGGPLIDVNPKAGPIPGTVTFTRRSGTVPSVVEVRFSDGITTQPLKITTPPASTTCP